MRRSAFFVCAALLAASHARVHAQPRLPLELSWGAPAECPAAAEVHAEVERIARVRPGFTLTPLVARAQVTRSAGRYGLELHTEHDGQQGERRLEASDCRTLVSSLTLVLALAFGAGVEIAEQTSAPAEPAEAPTAAAPATEPALEQPSAAATDPVDGAAPEEADTDAAVAPDAEPASASTDADADDAVDTFSEPGPARFSVLLGGGAQFALLPAAALAASAGAELELGALSVDVRATGWPAVSDEVGADLQARFDGLGGALQGCGHAGVETLSLALCAGGRAAAVRGRSSGARDDGSDTAPWYALSGAASLTWPHAEPVRIRLEAALAVSLNRARFVIEGPGEVHRVPLLIPNVGLLLLITP